MKPRSQQTSQPQPSAPDWDLLVSCLPPSWEAEARALGAFQRPRKIGSPEDLLRLVLMHAGVGLSLQRTVEAAECSGMGGLSKVAAWYRVQGTGPWLRGMIRELLQERIDARTVAGYHPRVVDATHVTGPAQRTQLRLHYSISLTTLGCTELVVTDLQQAESLERFAVAPDDLLIGDRIYAKARGIAQVRRAGGDVLVRLGRTSLTLYDRMGLKLDWLAWCRKPKGKTPGERFAQFRDDRGEWMPGRLVAFRLPKTQAAQARRRCLKAGRRQGRPPRPKALQAAGYVCLFTTAPRERLSRQAAADLYRARWQIEMHFKRLKSLLHADQLRSTTEASARIWLLAKMLYALLLEACLQAAGAFSPSGRRSGVTPDRPHRPADPHPSLGPHPTGGPRPPQRHPGADPHRPDPVAQDPLRPRRRTRPPNPPTATADPLAHRRTAPSALT
jgi:hypothetical protein